MRTLLMVDRTTRDLLVDDCQQSLYLTQGRAHTGEHSQSVAPNLPRVTEARQKEKGFLVSRFDPGLLQLDERVAIEDLLARLDVNRSHDAGPFGPQALLHFHGFEHAYLVAGDDLVSLFDGHGHYDARHW